MRILTKFLAPLVLLGLSGCMQHNGDIGDWFGTWKLESIEVNGATDASYADNVFFQFQTDVVRMVAVLPYQAYSDRFGSWEQDGNTLILNYSYTAAGTQQIHNPLPQTYLDKAANILQISEMTSRRMTWRYEKPDSVIVYTLRKQ